MDNQTTEFEQRLNKLQDKMIFFDKVFWVIVAVAAIFGITGAWGISTISAANETINKLQFSVETAQQKIITLQSEIDSSREKFTETVTEAETALEKKRKELSTQLSLDISDVAEQKIETLVSDITKVQTRLLDANQKLSSEISDLRTSQNEFVRIGEKLSLKSVEGFLRSNAAQRQDEKAVLISQSKTLWTTWMIER